MDIAKSDIGLVEITENDIANLRSMDDADAAEIFDLRLIELERFAKRSFIEMGIICVEVKRRDLWRMIVGPDGQYFHSIDAWIMSRLGVARSSAYDAMKVLLIEEATLEDLRQMPRVNAVRLSKLSSDVQRDPAIIEAAKGTEKAFVEMVQGMYPDQHVEKTRTIVAKPTATAREAMDECFLVVCWAYDLGSREDVLENLCAYFMDGTCEREGYSQYSNRNAYMHATGRQ